MSNRVLSFLIVLALLSAGALLLMNIFNIQDDPLENHFLSANNVKAVEIYSKGVPHPLTFEQQNLFIKVINRAVRTGFEEKVHVTKGPFSYDKIVIHQFEGGEVTAKPYGLVNSQLLLTVSEWNPEGLIRETGPGKLNTLFSDTVSQ